MIFTGTNRMLLPEVKEFAFTFSNLVINTSGSVTLAFEDCHKNTISKLVFSGHKITEYRYNRPYNRSVGTFNNDEAIQVSGYVLNNTGYADFEYFINGVQFNTKDNYNLTYQSGTFLIDVPTGDIVSCDMFLYSQPFNYQFNIPSFFNSFTALTGQFTTDTNFWILNSNTTYSQSYQNLFSGDPIIGPVNTGLPLTIVLPDIDDSNQDYIIDFNIDFTSNLGPISEPMTVTRTGIFNNETTQFSVSDNISGISGEFDGDWEINQFVFDDEPQGLTKNFFYSKVDVNGNSIGNSITISFQPSYPSNSGHFKSEYVTGFSLTSSGEYLQSPDVMFTGYYYITGIAQTLPSLLFSTGCTGQIPVIFSGFSGAGATGNLQLLPVTFNNVYQSGIHNYNIVTSFNMVSGGTGYLGSPTAIVLTGAYTNCYDVPNFYGSSYSVFSRFNTSGTLEPLAYYLTGEVLTTTGLVSGELMTGLIVTGINITNIGSGYNSTFLPLMSFIRHSGDTLTKNASGILSTKASGIYNFTGDWTVETGWSNLNFSIMTGFTGQFFTEGQYFSVRMTCSGLDNTEPIITQLSVTPTHESGIITYISNTKYYDTDPLFLKKKISVEELSYPAGSDLSFLINQDDLDLLYSSILFTNNGGLNIGNLDF